MEHRRTKTFIYTMIAVWSTTLFKDTHPFESQSTNEKWTAPPSMHAFEDYEDFQKFSQRTSKSLKKLENPLDDSYINAYNFHHQSPDKIVVKRDTEAVQSPQIFKFEKEDAKEPDELTKELIRIHRERQMRLDPLNDTTLHISKRKTRSAQMTEPKLIRFEISDAKEPDEQTKKLIRQSRARELRMATEQKVIPKTVAEPQTGTKKIKRKRNRMRRSAQMTQPQFIRFELEDAKEPDHGIREVVQQRREREMKSNFKNQPNETRKIEDSSVQESKQFVFYQATPMKSKRVANSIPTEVQNIIDLMLKDNKARVYYKYITPNQDAKLKAAAQYRPIYGTGLPPVPSAPASANLVTLYPEPAYVQKLIPIPVPIQNYPVNILPHPVNNHSPRPIVVPEVTSHQQYYQPTAPSQPDTNVYQQPTTYVKVNQAVTQVLPTPGALQQYHQPELSLNSVSNNEISNRYQYAHGIPAEPSHPYGNLINPNEETKQEILTVSGHNIQPQQQVFSQNNVDIEQQKIPLKDMQEFQELSSLIGRSPTDQVHGLAYLLAKEMQRNKRLKAQRSQDNTSPILFHPEKNLEVSSPAPTIQQSEEATIHNHQPRAFVQPTPVQSLQPEYNQIIEVEPQESYASQVNNEPAAEVSTQAPPTPTSFNYIDTLGLSPNYQPKENVGKVPTFHSTVEDGHGLQYASKYVFGYRVRDFASGNDFGHKQNRDIDGVTRGQYHVLLPDGRVQNVIYHADDSGFHADVSFETAHQLL